MTSFADSPRLALIAFATLGLALAGCDDGKKLSEK